MSSIKDTQINFKKKKSKETTPKNPDPDKYSQRNWSSYYYALLIRFIKMPRQVSVHYLFLFSNFRRKCTPCLCMMSHAISYCNYHFHRMEALLKYLNQEVSCSQYPAWFIACKRTLLMFAFCGMYNIERSHLFRFQFEKAVSPTRST